MSSPTVVRGGQSLTAEAGGAEQRTFGLLLDHGPLAPATARHEARGVLEQWGLGKDHVYDLLLVISELVTNAVTYALPPVVLHLQAAADSAGHVQVHVSDGGPRLTAAGWAADRPDAEHGRGEAIVAALADHTGAGPGTDGLIDHWADLPPA
ncbi:ATP-binding protein [Streptomyces sp. NPDC005805]|uniref:ATP-binding protein n=1 Tax=Streptomyces sp. NPDC005805 TaxID=3157068 RepID=UPI00340CD688